MGLNLNWVKGIAAAAGSVAAQKVASTVAQKIVGKTSSPAATTPSSEEIASNTARTALQSAGLTEQSFEQAKAIMPTVSTTTTTTWYAPGDWLIVATQDGKFFAGKNTQTSAAVIAALAKQFNWQQG